MKTRIKITLLSFLLVAGSFAIAPKAEAHHFSITFQSFYNQLSPYGTWMYLPPYGYVWRPDVAPGFFPYCTNGDWVYTDAGWMWNSFYPWGWAPFHYGRWYVDPAWGPVWIPGYEWSPAWVAWRSSGIYCGWAPLGPGMTADMVFGPGFAIPAPYWRFVRYRDFGGPHMDHDYLPTARNREFLGKTTFINNFHENQFYGDRYLAGPHRNDVERITGRNITPLAVRDRERPGQEMTGNHMDIFRPQVERYDSRGPAPVPSKVIRPDDYGTRQYNRQVQEGNRPGREMTSPGVRREEVNRSQQMQRPETRGPGSFGNSRQEQPIMEERQAVRRQPQEDRAMQDFDRAVNPDFGRTYEYRQSPYRVERETPFNFENERSEGHEGHRDRR